MGSIRRSHRPDSSGAFMSAPRKYQPHDLHAWVRFATIELTAPVKKRFLFEIEERYSEAVSVHLAEGLSEPDALREALAELGDPSEAAKRFRKQHLTLWDADRIKAMLRDSAKGDPFLWLCSFLLLWFMGMHIPLIHRILVLAASFFMTSLLPQIGKTVARRRRIGLYFLFFCCGLPLGRLSSVYVIPFSALVLF
jgi:hypothetical protein